MKKSCSVKESKVVTSKDVDGGLNEENLTEEQVYINKKLSETRIQSEGLDWLEKKNIFKTINVSFNSPRSDRSQRSSPRFAKTSSSRAGSWVENSFENQKTEDTNRNWDNEKISKTRSIKADTEFESPSSKKSKPLKTSEDHAEIDLKGKNLKDVYKNGEINGSSPKSSKKIHYIKIQVEGNSKEECRPSSEGFRKEDSQGLCPGKKRTSPPEAGDVDAAKKLKMDGEGVEEEVPLKKEEAPLRIEAEMERRRRGLPFKMRDIKTIVSEQDSRNKKWKETFSKYKWPARWGVPVVRSCSEKWDGKRIPPKLLHRYQKYLSSNNLFHPVFLPGKSLPSEGDSNKLSEMNSESGVGMNSECKDELGNDFRDASEGPLAEDESKKSAAENNLSQSSSESNSRMVLRNRSQQKPVILDEDGCSSDDSDEWLTKQKPLKKQKTNSKNKKNANQNKQLVLKLERCNINKKNGGEHGRKNENESFPGSPLLGSNSLNQSESPPKLGPDPDTMVCPICSLRFKKQLIESHATECASKTYKD